MIEDGDRKGGEEAHTRLDGRIFVRVDCPDWKYETHIKNGDMLDYQTWLQTPDGRGQNVPGHAGHLAESDDADEEDEENS